MFIMNFSYDFFAADISEGLWFYNKNGFKNIVAVRDIMALIYHSLVTMLAAVMYLPSSLFGLM